LKENSGSFFKDINKTGVSEKPLKEKFQEKRNKNIQKRGGGGGREQERERGGNH